MEFLSYFFNKKQVVVLFLSVSSVIFSSAVYSQETTIQGNSDEVKVKYIEGDNDELHFNLKYDNESGSDFKLMVLTETGDILFQNNYSGKKFRKNLKLPRLTDTGDVTFLIKSKRKNIQISYTVKVKDKVADKRSVASR